MPKYHNFKRTIGFFLIQCIIFSVYGQNNSPFKSGENLTYLLHYGWLDGGTATLSLEETSFNDNPVYYASTVARSVGLADVLYKVYDVYESYFSIENDLPYKSIRNIQEGNYRYYNEVYFHHDEDSVTSKRSGKHAVPKDCHDMLSALYYLRKIISPNMKVNDTMRIETFFGDEVFPMIFKFKGIENVKTSLGSFKCYTFVPVVEVGRVFKNEDDMIIWISTKPNHVPIRVRFNLMVGSLKCDLIEYENLKYGL